MSLLPPLLEQEIATSPTARPAPRVDPASLLMTAAVAVSTPNTPATLEVQIGTVLPRRFALCGHVATGGTVDVYRARDLLADRFDPQHSTVALKVLSRRLSADADSSAAILGAAAQMRRLRHPNIEQVLELHQFGDDYVIVTEWLDGESLAAHFDQTGPLRVEELAPILTGVGAALDYAHQHDAVHGDIKPGNVFLCSDGRVKLVDCGYRLPADAMVPAAQREDPAGSTPLYASCEVLQNLPPTPQDDVYSLACLIYRVTTGEWPFGLNTALQAEEAGARPARPKALSRKQWLAVRRGLEFRRAGRLSNSQELIGPFIAERATPPRTFLAILVLLFAAVIAWSSWPSGIARQSAAEAPRRATGQTVGTEAETQIEKAEGLETRFAAAGAADATLAPAAEARTSAQRDVPVLPAFGAVLSAIPAERRRNGSAAPPTIGFSTAQVVARASAGFIKLHVGASGHLRGPVQLSVTALEGAARVNEDFVPPNNRLNLSPSTPSGDILVSFLKGTRREHVEDFSVVLGIEGGYARLGKASVRVVLMENSEVEP